MAHRDLIPLDNGGIMVSAETYSDVTERGAIFFFADRSQLHTSKLTIDVLSIERPFCCGIAPASL